MPTLWIFRKKTDDVLHSIPIVAPWYHVGIDLVKMPKSKSGNSYILSLVDYPENGLPNMTEKGVCLVVLWTIVRYENNNSGKKISQSFWSSLQIFSIIFFSQWAFQQFTAVIKAESLSIPLCHR
jgi:hypothetical protein